MDYSWYENCNREDNTLQQGDFIPECPIIIPPAILEEGIDVDVDVKNIDSIVLLQSCDLEHGKIEIVLVCPYLPLTQWLKQLRPEQQTRGGIKNAIKELQKGHYPGYHVLNRERGLIEDYQVVDFKNVYGINFQFLSNLISNREERIRLMPPYKEHLSQAFARYFMRVGLPQDLRIDDGDFWPLNE